jgi:four helix bundle protein
LESLGFLKGAGCAQPFLRPSKADDLAARLKRFAIRVVKFARALQRDPAHDVIARQLVKSDTSQSANYHSARRGRSRDEFIAKLGVAAEEADETEHWFVVITGSGIVAGARALQELAWLSDESRQLRAILVASFRTARRNRRKQIR